jgi:hypothetical protein
MAGRKSMLGHKQEEAIAALLSQRNIEEAAKTARNQQSDYATAPPLLAKIIGSFLDLDAVLAGLNLADDAVAPSVPFEVVQQLENAFVERRPHGTPETRSRLSPGIRTPSERSSLKWLQETYAVNKRQLVS